MSAKLTLPYPPSVNNLYFTPRNSRRRVLTSEGSRFKQAAAAIAARAGVRPISGNVYVKLDLYRPAKRGDIDNYAKAAIDSLTGIAWEDDRQICELHMKRFEDKANPRVEIEVKAV